MAPRDTSSQPFPLSSGRQRVSCASAFLTRQVLTAHPENIVKATQELGIAINDQATGRAYGGYFPPHNQDPKAVTRSSAQAYYTAAEKRSNFHLLPSHLVSQIMTQKSNGVPKVTGVKFATSANAKSQQVKVKKEAILAAGALHTPQLLQVSGIGDPALHASIKVPTVVNLPAVGHNLHDHFDVVLVNTRE